MLSSKLGWTRLESFSDGNQSTAPVYIREVNGIRIAVLAYAYGFNGMETLLSQEE